MDDTKRIISKQILVDTANAIRTKKGTSNDMSPSEFANEISSIETQKPTQTKTVNPIIVSQTVTPDEGFELSEVTISAARVKYATVKTRIRIFKESWSSNQWNLTVKGNNVWTDGTFIYASAGTTHLVLDEVSDRWSTKTWTGLTDFSGADIWTDGKDIYYSSGTNQYVLDIATSTWSAKTWTGLTNFSGSDIWTDGKYIYYSSGTNQYVLTVATSTWSAKTWTGLTDFSGANIWSDGKDIYYSSGTNQYVLEYLGSVWGSTWSAKTWTGLTNFSGSQTWTDGINIYYSGNNRSAQYTLDAGTSAWTQMSWSGTAPAGGNFVWTDGKRIHYSVGANSNFTLGVYKNYSNAVRSKSVLKDS